MAILLAVDASLLADLIRRTFDERTRGRLGNLPDTVRWWAKRLGSEPDDDAIDAAVQLRLAMTRRLHEDTWALSVLAALLGARWTMPPTTGRCGRPIAFLIGGDNG